MSHFNEHTLEMAIMELFEQQGYRTHVSLDEFCRKYSSEVSWRYLVYTKDLRKDGETLMVPVCMVPFL